MNEASSWSCLSRAQIRNHFFCGTKIANNFLIESKEAHALNWTQQKDGAAVLYTITSTSKNVTKADLLSIADQLR